MLRPFLFSDDVAIGRSKRWGFKGCCYRIRDTHQPITKCGEADNYSTYFPTSMSLDLSLSCEEWKSAACGYRKTA